MSETATYRLTKRNLGLLTTLARFRILSTSQVHAMCFPGASKEAAANLLRRLEAAGYVARLRVPMMITAGAVAHRPEQAWIILPEHWRAIEKELGRTERADEWDQLAGMASDAKHTHIFNETTVRHELGISAVYAALEQGVAQNAAHQLPFWWRTSPRHKDVSLNVRATLIHRETGEATERLLPINPDAVHAITTERGTSFYFLEYDNATETNQDKIMRKFIAYVAYVKQGLFADKLVPILMRRYQLKLTHPERASFRVLFICSSEKRRNDLILKSRVFPFSSLFQFASVDEFVANPFGPVFLSKKAITPWLHEYNAKTHELGVLSLKNYGFAKIDETPKHSLL